jgi:ABC-type branched-subunit amino acid transport system substrate-binding protein
VFPPDTLFGTAAADSYRGVSAMVAAINNCGGVMGRSIELIFVSAGNYEEAVAAINRLSGDVAVIIGSGSAVVSDVLVNAAGEGTFFYWEVSEPLEKAHSYALSARPNNAQLGAQAVTFVQTDIQSLLEDSESLRVALVYEDNPRAQAVAAGVLQTLDDAPLIEHVIKDYRAADYQLAVKMREHRINAVIVAAFEHDSDRLWVQLRQADANPVAWVQVGGSQYRQNMCSRIGNTDGIISISAVGAVSEQYRQDTIGPHYAGYLTAYEAQFQRLPGERSDLAASGTYMLLREILPHVSGNFKPVAVQQAANTTSSATSLMSEGWSLDPATSINQLAVAIVAQQQSHAFCTISPESVATCNLPLQPLPTWRERVRTSSC